MLFLSFRLVTTFVKSKIQCETEDDSSKQLKSPPRIRKQYFHFPRPTHVCHIKLFKIAVFVLSRNLSQCQLIFASKCVKFSDKRDLWPQIMCVRVNKFHT